MSKKIVIPKSLEQIEEIINICDGFIIGLNNLSVNLPHYFNIEEIKKITLLCKKHNKKVFISLNKNIHNEQIIELTNALIDIAKLDISGLLFYDIAIVNLNNRLNLNLNLIWHQEHLVTNYQTINYWCKNGVYGSFLSSELTLDEILMIRHKTKCPLMMNVFGFIPMFTSKRPLVKNYLSKFSLEDNSKINYLEKENNIYQIIDDGITTVYSSKILNLLSEVSILEDKIDYFVLNSFNISNDAFEQILRFFYCVKSDNCQDLFKKANMLLNYNIDTGFLYKNTVYKVKKNEQNKE